MIGKRLGRDEDRDWGVKARGRLKHKARGKRPKDCWRNDWEQLNGSLSPEDRSLSFDGSKRDKKKRVVASTDLSDIGTLKYYQNLMKEVGKHFFVCKGIPEIMKEENWINYGWISYKVSGEIKWITMDHLVIRLEKVFGSSIGSKWGDKKRLSVSSGVLNRGLIITVRQRNKSFIKKMTVGAALELPDLPLLLAESNAGTQESSESSVNESDLFQDEDLKRLKYHHRYFNYPAVCEMCDEAGHLRERCPLRFGLEECRYCLSREHRGRCVQVSCMKCKQMGHELKDCPLKVTSLKEDYCVRCKSWGHVEERCSTFIFRPVPAHEMKERMCCVCNEKGHLEDFHFDGTIIKMFI